MAAPQGTGGCGTAARLQRQRAAPAPLPRLPALLPLGCLRPCRRMLPRCLATCAPLLQGAHERCDITGGWRVFTADNGLQVGDEILVKHLGGRVIQARRVCLLFETAAEVSPALRCADCRLPAGRPLVCLCCVSGAYWADISYRCIGV